MAMAKRDHLIDTALGLFSRDGYHAVGIDRILAEAGVAKMTLYNHFKSKDELILAVLRRRDEEFRHWFAREVEKHGETPRERLSAIFDALDVWFRSPSFYGCMFIGASGEFADSDTAIRRACVEHKRLTLDYYRNLAEAAGADDAAGLAGQILLLVEGATVAAHTAGQIDAAQKAKATAEILISAAGL